MAGESTKTGATQPECSMQMITSEDTLSITPHDPVTEQHKDRDQQRQKNVPSRPTRKRRPPARYREAFATTKETMRLVNGYTLQSDQQHVLRRLYQKYGNEQFTKSKAPDIPEWLFLKALEEEMSNWEGHYSPFHIGETEPGANIVGSHVIYRIKRTTTTATGSKRDLSCMETRTRKRMI